MFDIVSKNKKLSFLVSFIKDNVSSHNNYDSLLEIQNKSNFIQSKISIIKQKKLKPFFSFVQNSIHTRPIQKKTLTLTNNLNKNNVNDTVNNTYNKNNKKLFSISNGKIVLHGHQSEDFLISGFLACIDSNFIQTSYTLQLEYIKTLKHKMAVELDTHNLYKEYGYNKIRSLKKTILQTSLFNNKDIHYNHFYRYIADYFGVNFILIIDNIFIQHFNELKNNKFNIIIYKNDTQFHIDTQHGSDECMYNNTLDLSQYIKYPGQTFKDFNKLKLSDIQFIAKRKNIPIKIFTKNKTKKILIEEILQL